MQRSRFNGHTELRDGLGKTLQDERPDQSNSNGHILDFFLPTSITDAAAGDTLVSHTGDPPSEGHFSLSVLFNFKECHCGLAVILSNPQKTHSKPLTESQNLSCFVMSLFGRSG